jgi:hypothetical protein
VGRQAQRQDQQDTEAVQQGLQRAGVRHRTEADRLIRTTTPGRLAHPGSDVFVPILQALAIAVAIALASGVAILLRQDLLIDRLHRSAHKG